MPSHKLEEFEKILDTGSAEEIQQFCRETISDLEEVTAAALMDFRRTYLNI